MLFPPYVDSQAPSYLTFNIGSVESFERNLEQVQKDMGIHSSEFLPVTYKADSDWLKSFFVSVFPTALLIGAIYFMSRKASGSKGVSEYGRGRAKIIRSV